jgi:hypothetical protein
MQKRFLEILGMAMLVLSLCLVTISCATTDGLPYSTNYADDEPQIARNIEQFGNSRDFVANNYADAYRAAVKEGYSVVLHIEKVKLGPFGIFGTHIRVTAVQP